MNQTINQATMNATNKTHIQLLWNRLLPVCLLILQSQLIFATSDSSKSDLDNFQFSLKIPEGWEKVEGREAIELFPSMAELKGAEKDRAFLYLPPDYEQRKISVVLLVREHSFPFLYNPRTQLALKKRQFDALLRMNPKVTMENFEVIINSFNNALRYDVLIPTAAETIRQTRYLSSGEKYNYTFIMSAPENKFQETNKNFEMILTSFNTQQSKKRTSNGQLFNEASWINYVLPAIITSLAIGMIFRSRKQIQKLRSA